MGKLIVIDNGNGTIGIMRPNLASGMTAEEIAKKDVPAGLSFEIIDESGVPADRTFREAWEKDAGTIKVNMPRARDIHRGRIRAARDIKLAELDIKQLKGNDVAAEKQVLRDLPSTFSLEGAKTPAALRKLWPAEL